MKRLTSEYLWRHVRHTTSYAGVQPAFRVMDGHVEIGEVNVTVSVQKDVVRLNITIRRSCLSAFVTRIRSAKGQKRTGE